MSYLDELEQINGIITKSEDFNYGQRILLIDIINEELKRSRTSEDPFIIFHEEVTNSKLAFDYKTNLPETIYLSANEEAKACLLIFPDFKKLDATTSLLSWLVNALKYTDQIVLYYIQGVLNESPKSDPDNGIERSRYIQINKTKYKAHVAGNLLNNLYDVRNKLEHRTQKDPKDPNKQIILPPNYNKAKRKIIENYPKALLSFEKAFIDHYKD